MNAIFLLTLLLLPSRDEYYVIFFVLLNKILPQDEAKAEGRQIFHMEKKDKFNIHHRDVFFCMEILVRIT